MITVIIATGILFILGILFYYVVNTKSSCRDLATGGIESNLLSTREWWAKRRMKYNKGLVIAGVTAFIVYAGIGSFLMTSSDFEFEITLFTIFFQGIGYLFMMLVANLFYNLGGYVDNKFNKENSEDFRQKLFNFGLYFSVSLPFLVPILLVITYFFE